MAMRPLLSLAAWALAAPAGAVQLADLVNFFTSPNGLSMINADAINLASAEADLLTRCGVTVPALQALRDAMYLPGKLNLDLRSVRLDLLPLAFQHASPDDLDQLYHALYYSVGLTQAQAQDTAMDLAEKHTQPSQVADLYNVLSSVVKWKSTSQNQQLAIGLASAGADAPTLRSVYTTMLPKIGAPAALEEAIKDAVVQNLGNLEGRYAKDGYVYVAGEFQRYYGDQWLIEWLAAPQEKRTAQDGKDYRASEFLAFFGVSSWAAKWKAAQTAVQRRIAKDGVTYTLEEFRVHYDAASWQAAWLAADEVLDVCAGLSQRECGLQRTCQWSWTGDPTTSCVVKPLAEDTIVV